MSSSSLSKLMLLKAILSIVLLALPVSAQDSLTYRVRYSTTKPDIVHIAIQPSQPLRGPLTLIIPRAITSGYSQRLYDRYVESVWAELSGRAFRLEELPGLIGKPVGVDEKEIKAIMDRWLR